jgi:CheY-like chemotaxis protein
VVDDEPDVEDLFRQQFRRDIRAGRFTMHFAQSGPSALQKLSDADAVPLILILSDINMPGMSGLELQGKLIDRMSVDEKGRLRVRLHDHLPTDADGRIVYESFANAVKGRVPLCE